MADTGDQYPGLPLKDWLSTKRDADTQFRVMEFLTQRPTGEQWAAGMEIWEALDETDPRTSVGEVYTTLERLEWAQYLETRMGEPEPLPPRPPLPLDYKEPWFDRFMEKLTDKLFGPVEPMQTRQRKYYRATSDGTRAYDNSKKTASRSPLPRPHQKPAIPQQILAVP